MSSQDHQTSSNKHKKSEDKTVSKEKAIKFNLGLLGFCVGLFLISKYIPSSFKYPLKSKFIIDNILPPIYFAVFSFCLGLVFLLGVVNIRDYLLTIINRKTLDIGIIASYTGVISMVISVLIKKIIEHIFVVKLVSSPIHDIIGFIIGRVILLSTVYYFKI